MADNVGSKITKVNHEQLKMILERRHETKIPTFIWGPPGIGKSDSVRQFSMKVAEEKEKTFIELTRGDLRDERLNVNDLAEDDFLLIDKRLADHDPAEIKGLQKFAGENDEETITSKPAWFPTNKNLEGVLLFDELNLAPELVQNAAYQIIHDRRLGKYQLPEGFSIISCGNRVQDRTNVYEMGKALQNRFAHLELIKPSVDSWSNWAEEHDVDSRLIGFLQNRRNMLFQFDPEDNLQKSFATPRTIEFASKDIKGIEYDEETRQLIKKLVGSNVGEAWASEFVTFLDSRNELDLEKLAYDPEEDDIKKRPDLLYCISSGLTEMYVNREEDKILESFMKIATMIDHAEWSKLMFRPIKKEYGHKFAQMLKNANRDLWVEVCDMYDEYLLESY